MKQSKPEARTLDRQRIWEVECPLLDAVLALSFDAGELLNCCESAGLTPPRHECISLEHQAVLQAHQACHEPSALALLLERRLDLMHGRILDELEARGVEEFSQDFLGRRAGTVPDLGGRLWALATLAGDELKPLRAHIRAVVAMGGLLALRGEQER